MDEHRDLESQPSSSSHFGDPSKNCICIHVAFVELLLPVLQFYVNHKMRDFFLNLLPSQAHMTAEKEIQKKAKKKMSKKKKMENDPLRVLQLQLLMKKAGKAKKGHQMKLSSHSDFAKLYLSKMQLVNFTSLEKCSDVRILLTIMAEVEYFSDEENDLAGKLKGSYHNTAHTQISKFTKQYTRDVLDNLEKLFQVIPNDTKVLEQVKRDLQQVKKYGSQALLQNRTEQEITALRNSLLSNVPPSLKASIEATFRDQEDILKNIEVVEKKMAGLWQKLPEIGEIFCTELELVSLKGNAANLKSIISTNKPKTKLVPLSGKSFKISKDPFDKGTSRLAYRGHFEDALNQPSDYFRDSPEVVVKVSSEDASTFQRAHIYAHEFAEEWNKMRDRREISFNWIVSVNLPGFEGTQTIEPYLNRKQYKKW